MFRELHKPPTRKDFILIAFLKFINVFIFFNSNKTNNFKLKMFSIKNFDFIYCIDIYRIRNVKTFGVNTVLKKTQKFFCSKKLLKKF